MAQIKPKFFQAVREYLIEHPTATYAEVIAVRACKQIATVQFYQVRTQLYNRGIIPKPNNFKSRKKQVSKGAAP
jgi:hypothetical protein